MTDGDDILLPAPMPDNGFQVSCRRFASVAGGKRGAATIGLSYDLVVWADVMMPGRAGWNLAGIVAEAGGACAVPTRWMRRKTASISACSEADDYVMKPFDHANWSAADPDKFSAVWARHTRRR